MKGVQIVEVAERSPELVERLVDVWERSVRATHSFLTEDEVVRIKGYVPDALRGVERLTVALRADDAAGMDDAAWVKDAARAGGPAGVDDSARGHNAAPLAFMGVADGRLEMLFVDPEARGQGVGSALLRHGIAELGVHELTVNEQNPAACGFYEHMGFETYKRTDTDEEGGPYPLLYMRLRERV